MRTLLSDLRYGLRLFKANPGFSAIVVLTMAIGIAANTTVFGWIDNVLLNPLPGVARPERMTALEEVAPSGEHFMTSYPDYRDLRDRSTLIESLVVAEQQPLNMGEGTHAERLWAELVSGNYFDGLGVKPELGRFFAGEERDDTPGAHAVVVLSHSLWKSRFHSDPAAVGATVRINRYPFTVIGVAPENFPGAMTGLAFQAWVPAMMYGKLTAAGDFYLRDRKTRMFLTLARLKPGVTIEQGRAEVQALMQRIEHENADTNAGMGATLVPMSQSQFGAQSLLREPLSILMAVCGVVLLIACVNVANLLLARAMAREKEFGIRTAMGARRSRLVRQLLTETLVLACAGSGLGLVFAAWMRGSLGWLLPATPLPTAFAPQLSHGALGFAAALAVVTALLAGLAPALHAGRSDVHEILKAGTRSATSGVGAQRLRGVLVMAEVALAVVALVGAGLFLKSFANARTIHPGFDANQVVLAQFHLSTAGYDAAQADSFCRRLRSQLEASPGVRGVSYADTVPLGFARGAWEDLEIEGYVRRQGENMKIYRNLVAPGYFDVMRIPLVSGRDFTYQDEVKTLPVMVVNEAFVRRFLPNQNPIGRRVNGWGRWFTIVGVAKDSKYHSLGESPKPFFYVPIRQVYRPEYPLTFHVRTAAPAEQAIAMVRREGQAVDPAVGLFDAMALSDYIAAGLFAQRVAASLLSVLGAIALVLASVGLYGVMAYAVTQRTAEIGIRMALGADPGDVLRLVVRQGVLFALGGLVAGSIAAAALARLASSTLLGVSPSDPTVYAGVAGFLMVVALAASWIPARRAMRVDPMVSLRCQ